MGCSTIGEGEVLPGPAEVPDLSVLQETKARLPGWPQWRGPERDGVVAGIQLPDRFPPGNWPEKWRVEVGDGFSGVVVGEGRVYCHARREDREVVSAHDPETGRILWSQPHEIPDWSQPFDAWGISDGPLATPAFAGGRLYTVSIYGRVHCHDASTGDVLFSTSSEEIDGEISEYRYGHASSPLVRDGMLLVNFSTGGKKGQLVALDAGTGGLLWRALPEPIPYTSPVLATIHGMKQIIARSWQRVAGLDPKTGEVLWSHEFPVSSMTRDCATPLVVGDVVYLTNSYHGTLAVRVSPVEGGTWKAEKIYRSGALGGKMASPVYHDGYLYGLHKTGRLVCMDARTGERRWIERAFGKYLSIISFGPRGLLLDEQGNLAMLLYSPERPVLEGRWKIGEYTWAYPGIDEKRFYFRDGTDLVCLELEPAEFRIES